MKKWSLIFLVSSLFIISCAPTRSSVSVHYDDYGGAQAAVGYDTFYDQLSPYGRWIDYPGYGYVWVPGAEAGFRPYATNGHWVYTDYGWTWVSGYQWGWATFHYGRWMYEEGYGWMWMPGHEWAPAWVTWGQSGGYYGWAPLAPRVNINVSMGGGWTPPAHYWNFVPAQHITQVNINNYVVNTTNNTTVVNNITRNVTVINNVTNNNYNVTNNNTNITNNNVRNTVVYNMGPKVNEVEQATHQPVQQVKIAAVNKPGAASLSNNQLMVYKPQVKEVTTNKTAPQKVEAYKPVNNAASNPNSTIPNNANNNNVNHSAVTNTINNNNGNNNNPTNTMVNEAKPAAKTPPAQNNNIRSVNDTKPVNATDMQKPVDQRTFKPAANINQPDNQKMQSQPVQQKQNPQQKPVVNNTNTPPSRPYSMNRPGPQQKQNQNNKQKGNNKGKRNDQRAF